MLCVENDTSEDDVAKAAAAHAMAFGLRETLVVHAETEKREN